MGQREETRLLIHARNIIKRYTDWTPLSADFYRECKTWLQDYYKWQTGMDRKESQLDPIKDRDKMET